MCCLHHHSFFGRPVFVEQILVGIQSQSTITQGDLEAQHAMFGRASTLSAPITQIGEIKSWF